MKKRVVIADDHTSIRQMLVSLFRRETEYVIVGEAGTGLETLEVCRATAPSRWRGTISSAWSTQQPTPTR